MKVKTSELIGVALAYAVGVADKRTIQKGIGDSLEVRGRTENGEELPPGWDLWMLWYPQSNWLQAGEIIEREKISLEIKDDGWWVASYQYNYSDMKEHIQLDRSPLIAAMRCYVASKLGDEVEVPEELV